MKTTNKSIKVLTLAMALAFSATTVKASQTELAKAQKTELLTKSKTNTVLGIDFKANAKGAFGVSITRVYDNGAASKMGLMESDVLLGIGETIIFEENVDNAFKAIAAGADVTLRVQRQGRNEFVKAKMPAIYNLSKGPAFLGVEMVSSKNKNTVGAEIKAIVENSSAKYASLRKGDRILGLDNNILVANNLNEVISKYNAGDQVTIRVQRGKEVFMINAVLGANTDKSIIVNDSSPITVL